jgi:molybdenum cofactor sulfurtransferase
MVGNLYGNPHSASPSSDLSTRLIKAVRSRILRFFGADPVHFDPVFVANASAAIKLVVEAFREIQAPGFWYGYHRDAHTSLVGIRQLAASSRCFESDKDVETWLLDDSSAEFLNGTFRPGGRPLWLSGTVKYERSSATAKLARADSPED